MRFLIVMTVALLAANPGRADVTNRPVIDEVPERVWALSRAIPQIETLTLIRPDCDEGEHRASCTWTTLGGVNYTAASPTRGGQVNQFMAAFGGGSGPDDLNTLVMMSILMLDGDIGVTAITDIYAQLMGAELDGEIVEVETASTHYTMRMSSQIGAWFTAAPVGEPD